MKILDGFVMRQLGDEYIIIGEGISRVNFNKMISLNPTAAYLWSNLQDKEEFTVDDMVTLLTDKYEVSEEVARKDAAALAEKWVSIGVVSQ